MTSYSIYEIDNKGKIHYLASLETYVLAIGFITSKHIKSGMLEKFCDSIDLGIRQININEHNYIITWLK